jgi:hypothetical protein
MKLRSQPLVLSPILGLVALAAGCGDDEKSAELPDRGPEIFDPGPVHVHGLGINPADESLFIATHTGLFRAPVGEERATRVAGRYQDTMGFTVVGPDRFLGSGHPDQREGLPPFLGLICSDDAGESWDPVSLLGKRDFHVLEASGKRVYGYGSDYESREAGLLVSDDGGKSWDERRAPEPLISAAIDPRDPDRLVASGSERLYLSEDGAQSWRELAGPPGLVAWTDHGLLFVVDESGDVTQGRGGAGFQEVSTIGAQPAALEAAGSELYVALHDGTVKRSADQGRSWQVRSQP